jgi:hypothetical protein
MVSLSLASDQDPRIKGPFKVDASLSFIHEKLHEYQLLEGVIKKEIRAAEKAEISKRDFDFSDLEEYFIRLINAREWGEKGFFRQDSFFVT